MSYRNREIESKWILSCLSLLAANQVLHKYLGSSVYRKITGTSTDTYWHITDPDVRADFLRVRELDNGVTQITAKGIDRGSNENRMEIDVETATSRGKVLALVGAAMGKPAGKVTKSYHVYWPTSDEHTNLSVYQVEGDSRIFLEIEAINTDLLRYWEETLQERLPLAGFGMERAPGSIYQMFIYKGEKQ